MERSPQQHEMAKKKVSLVDVDKNYIDTPSQNKEFEFQTKKVSLRTRYPADELFFKGKLLPLNLLPRVLLMACCGIIGTTIIIATIFVEREG